MTRPLLRWTGGVLLLAVLIALSASGAGAAPAGHAADVVGAAAAGPARRLLGVVPDIARGAHLGRPGRPRARGAARAGAASAGGRPRARIANLDYNGGLVVHSNRTHLIFWQPSGSGLSFDPGYVALIERFMGDVAADSHLPTNVYSLSGQYSDRGGPAAYDSSYGGAVIATDRLPPNDCVLPATGPGWSDCVVDSDLQAEINRVVAANHLPTTSEDIYFLLTPSGLGSCENPTTLALTAINCSLGGSGDGGAYCGYHSVTQSGFLYSYDPYNDVPTHCQSDGFPTPNSNSADMTISTLSHEHNETVTDPDGRGWIDNSNAQETGDLCASDFGNPIGSTSGGAYNQLINGHGYNTQLEYSNAISGCAASAPIDPVSVAAPGVAAGDRTISFRGSASQPGGAILAYDWFFGDGRHATHHLSSHAFTRAGSFTVILRSTDAWANWSFAVHKIRITVPPHPVVAITGKPAGRTSSTRPRFKFSSTAAIASFACKVDGGSWRSCRSVYTTPHLRPGHHRFSVRATDTFRQTSRQAASDSFMVM